MRPAPKLAILILAAGRSTRMGRDKLLMRGPDGDTLLEGRLRVASATPYPVFVALDPDNRTRQEAVKAWKARAVICPDAKLGMGHSLAQAVAQLPKDLDGLVILLGDMPEITTSDILLIGENHAPDHVVRGCDDALRPGHPVLIPAVMFSRIMALSTDRGAKEILKQMPIVHVKLPGNHATADIDTPQDWTRWTRCAAPRHIG